MQKNKQEKLIIISNFLAVNALWGKKKFCITSVGKPYELSVVTIFEYEQQQQTTRIFHMIFYASFCNHYTLNFLIESNIFGILKMTTMYDVQFHALACLVRFSRKVLRSKKKNTHTHHQRTIYIVFVGIKTANFIIIVWSIEALHMLVTNKTNWCVKEILT